MFLTGDGVLDGDGLGLVDPGLASPQAEDELDAAVSARSVLGGTENPATGCRSSKSFGDGQRSLKEVPPVERFSPATRVTKTSSPGLALTSLMRSSTAGAVPRLTTDA